MAPAVGSSLKCLLCLFVTNISSEGSRVKHDVKLAYFHPKRLHRADKRLLKLALRCHVDFFS